MQGIVLLKKAAIERTKNVPDWCECNILEPIVNPQNTSNSLESTINKGIVKVGIAIAMLDQD